VQRKFFKLGAVALSLALAACSWGSKEETIEDVYLDDYTVPADLKKAETDSSSLAGAPTVPAEEVQSFEADPDTAAKVFNKRVPPLNSLIVCRDKQCAPAELSKSREYIFNALAQVIDNNIDTTALLCEANPQAHVCTNPYLTVPAKIGVTPAYVFFDGVKIVDASLVKGGTGINLALGYNLSYNGQTPTVCKPDVAMLYVKSNNKVVLNGNGFKCDMTSVGTTKIRILFNVDYIDLDYGYIGGYYSIGLSGPAYGGGNGYGLIRMINDVQPLKPVLPTMGRDSGESASPAQASVRPRVNDGALNGDKAADDDRSAKALQRVVEESQGFRNNDEQEHINTSERPAKPEKPAPKKRNFTLEEREGLPQVEVYDNGQLTFEETTNDDLDDYIK
jgi:hypothetical protein